MESLRGFSPFNNASGILNAILADCMASGGIKKPEIFKRTFPVLPPYRPEFLDTNARARMTSERVRVVCGARTKAGHPCPTKSLPGKRRCKWHGGASTGPRTPTGKARARANLRQFSQEREEAV
jgi:hypothetical protein